MRKKKIKDEIVEVVTPEEVETEEKETEEKETEYGNLVGDEDDQESN